MKNIKKTISLLTCFVLTFMLATTNVCAIQLSKTDTSDIKMEYIETRLKDYLLMDGYSSSDSFFISNSFSINYYENNSVDSLAEIYFIFKDNAVISMLTVMNINNEYTSRYSKLSSSIISNLFNSNTPFSVGYIDDDLCVCFNNQIVSLNSNTEINTDPNQINATSQTITKAKGYYFVQTRSSLLFSKTLDIDIVANGTSPYDGTGMCWAATIAMKVNYLNPTYNNSLNARAVLELLRMKYTTSIYGYPIGTKAWIQRGFNYFNISCTTFDRGLSTSEVSNQIQNNNPIFIALKRDSDESEKEEEGDYVAHAVLIVGCSVYSDHAIYVIADSNALEYHYQDVSYAAMSNPDEFIYYYPHWYTGDIIYTYPTWYLSIY